MRKFVFGMIGVSIALVGFALATPAHAMTVTVNADTIGAENTIALSQALGALRATLNTLEARLAQENIAVGNPNAIRSTLGAIRGNLLEIRGTVVALDARATQFASANAPTTVIVPGMSLDGVPATIVVKSGGAGSGGLEAALAERETSMARIASLFNIGWRTWSLLAVLIAAFSAVAFFMRKWSGEEPEVVIQKTTTPVIAKPTTTIRKQSA